MKTLIIYESKKGMTKKVAELISKDYDDVKVVTTKNNEQLEEYDTIIIGTPVYVGKIHKKVRLFLDQHSSILRQKQSKIFLVGMNFEGETEAINLNFTEEQRKDFEIHYVAGGYNFDKMNFLEKFIIKKVAGVTSSQEVIKQEKLALYLKK